MAIKKEHNRAMILAVIGVFATLWALINAQEQFYAATMYLIFAGVIIYFYTQWNKIGRFF